MDELADFGGGKCILQFRGVRPFLSDKYDITKHPNYKYLSDYDPRSAFHIEKFLSTKLKPKPDDVFNTYHKLEDDGPGEANQPVRRNKARRYRLKCRADGLYHADQLFPETGSCREMVRRAELQAALEDEQIGNVR